MASPDEPIACSLTPALAEDQLLEWSELQGHATRVHAVANGARMWLPASLAPAIADLVRREAACCAFLEIVSETIGESVVMDVTSTRPDAIPVIALLAGVEIAADTAAC